MSFKEKLPCNWEFGSYLNRMAYFKKHKISGRKTWNRQVFVCVCACSRIEQQLDSSYLYAKSRQCRAFAGAASSQTRVLKILHSVPSGYLHGLADVYTSREFYLQVNWKRINFRLLTHLQRLDQALSKWLWFSWGLSLRRLLCPCMHLSCPLRAVRGKMPWCPQRDALLSHETKKPNWRTILHTIDCRLLSLTGHMWTMLRVII